MAKCNRPDCGRGDIDRQNFCSACSRHPLPDPEPPAQRAALARPDPWWGLDPAAGAVTPRTATKPGTEAMPGTAGESMGPDMTVAEGDRFCTKCEKPVGRGSGGRPGRVMGFCPVCRTAFDFTRSRLGERIGERYVIKQRIGRGGHGTAFLAHDSKLETDVVLKDLSSSPEVADTAALERDTLRDLRHDNIVRIYGYEPDGPYLVLEYVRGAQLAEDPYDRLEVILAHGLQILQALDYLHARGLLHMDVKPANIIRFSDQGADGPRDRVRLIDFGAVRKLGTGGRVEVYTSAYAPPENDPEHRNPTCGFDLFCVGQTLKELCRHYPRDPATPAASALDRALERATHPTPERRFVSARQFAEQLSGVIQQAVAARPDRRVIRPSAIFGSMTEPLHGGLGAPRPVSDWIRPRISSDQRLMLPAPFGAPEPGQAVAALPAPLEDPYDPGPTRSCANSLRVCSAQLRNGNPKAAEDALRAANLPGWTWLGDWYRGLIYLARGDRQAAGDRFGRVRDALPGDLIPVLSLGLCAEINGQPDQAGRHYWVVADAAPSLSAAGLGLARALWLTGNRAGAAEAAKRLAADLQSQAHQAEQEARIAVVRLLAAVGESSLPTEDELAEAEELAKELRIGNDQKSLLDAEIQYGKYRISKTADGSNLSEKVREIAKQADPGPEFISMIDLANGLRPPIGWPWPHGFRVVRLREGT